MTLVSYIEQKLNRPDLGLLILRVVFGLLITTFGVAKLFGGGAMLAEVGGALAKFGITFAPMFWGLLSALTETLGGLCILLGIFFRPAAALLFFNMIVAITSMWGDGPDYSSFGAFMGYVQKIVLPVAFCAIFLALLLTGPGKYAVHKGSGGKGGGGAGKSKD
jgi:putative oxidoreductase